MGADGSAVLLLRVAQPGIAYVAPRDPGWQNKSVVALLVRPGTPFSLDRPLPVALLLARGGSTLGRTFAAQPPPHLAVWIRDGDAEPCADADAATGAATDDQDSLLW